MQARWRAESGLHKDDDSHLRSIKAVTGYHIQATDGEIGHVENMLLDDHTWAIRYLVVDTSNWWGGHHVLVAPQWIQRVSWAEATVSVDVTRQAVKDALRTIRRRNSIGSRKWVSTNTMDAPATGRPRRTVNRQQTGTDQLPLWRLRSWALTRRGDARPVFSGGHTCRTPQRMSSQSDRQPAARRTIEVRS